MSAGSCFCSSPSLLLFHLRRTGGGHGGQPQPPPPHPAASVYDLFDYGLWVTVAPGQQLWNVLGTELP